jgi:5'-deoxynucleotidase YfbR-like HD superfamily hydrolase
MSDLTFRTKVGSTGENTPVENTVLEKKEGVVLSSDKEEKELSPELYSKTEGKPYLVKMLELENIYEDLSSDVLSAIDTIEDYFKSLVKKGKRTNDKTSYKEFFSYLENIVSVRNQPVLSKIEKIADFIKTIQKVKEYGKHKDA